MFRIQAVSAEDGICAEGSRQQAARKRKVNMGAIREGGYHGDEFQAANHTDFDAIGGRRYRRTGRLAAPPHERDALWAWGFDRVGALDGLLVRPVSGSGGWYSCVSVGRSDPAPPAHEIAPVPAPPHARQPAKERCH